MKPTLSMPSGKRAESAVWGICPTRVGRRAVALMFALAIVATPGGCPTADKRLEASAPPAPNPRLMQLAERAEAAIAAAGNSIGREHALRLGSEHRPAWLAYFKGRGPKPPHQNQEYVVRDINRLIGLMNAAKTWPAPGTHQIPKAKKAPVIDGKLDDEAWKQAAVWTDIYLFDKTEKGGPPTTWRMTWDNKYLYFAFDCSDTDVAAPKRKRDDNVWNDDCVEMFILPDFRFRTYWEIVIAPNGSVFDSVQCKDLHNWGCNNSDPTQDVTGMKHAQTVRGTLNKSDDTDEGYTVEVAVPFSSLPGYTRCGPKPGHRLHFMLVRLDRTRGRFKTYAFRPLQGWGHNIWNHAVMVLTDASDKK